MGLSAFPVHLNLLILALMLLHGALEWTNMTVTWRCRRSYYSFHVKMEIRPTLTLVLAFWENYAEENSGKVLARQKLGVMLWKHDSAGGLESSEATGRLWFSILAWMRRVGAETLFWQQLMWCETAFNDTRHIWAQSLILFGIWDLFFTKPDRQFQKYCDRRSVFYASHRALFCWQG